MELTEQAAGKLQELLSDEAEGTMLRVAVRPGGCAGFSYEMYFDSAKEETDNTIGMHGVTVVVDSASKLLLEGATLDYKTGLSGGFAITNPNAQRTCGCGSSFS